MADHHYVDLVVGWLNNEWQPAQYPGTYDSPVPAIIDADDAESEDFQGRQVHFDLMENNAVEVSSSPDRQQEAIGTEFDYRFDDGVSIRVVAAHNDAVDFGGDDAGPGVAGADEFRQLYQEVRRIVHNHRVWPDRNASGSQHTDRMYFPDETNLSHRYTDLYEWQATAAVRGFEEL